MKLSKKQKAKNRKMFGCENLKISRAAANTKLKNLMTLLQSNLYSIRDKFDLIIANYKATLTDDIIIIKCPILAKVVGSAYRIPNSKIVFTSDPASEAQQIWIPFDTWDKLGKDFEKVYKKYIDWELIARYK